MARSLAVLCYRTTEGVEQRFAQDTSRDGVVGWLQHHGETFSRRFDTAAYRCLGRSLDGHQIDPETIRAPTTVFAVREDLTVPLSLLHEYVKRAGENCQLVEISSVHGHDAFLKEEAAVSTILAAALEPTSCSWAHGALEWTRTCRPPGGTEEARVFPALSTLGARSPTRPGNGLRLCQR